MDSHVHKINRDLVVGWMIIVGILFVSYVGEVMKGERTLPYLLVFMLVTALPAVICMLLYFKKPDMVRLRYYIVAGYFLMYLFSMMTGSTSMVFSYILPMLSFLVLYHQPGLILATGAASMAVNLISVGLKFLNGSMTLQSSKDGEIQLALLFLCFGGSYVATKLYDEITNENTAYLHMLDEKNNQIQKMTLQSIATIANTIDAKDEYTQGHSKRVSEYSAAIAEELGLSEDEVQNIRFVALLHDIGKIGVPDSVLNKPGKLTDEEYHLMKQHTVTGGEILKDINMIPGIDIGAKYHHERYDGRGYPEGLKGQEIPFIARIISVADAYDAMTSNRIYRKQLDNDKVMRELEEGVGTQFDPEAAKAMIRLLKEERLEKIDSDKTAEKEIAEATTILSRVMEKNEMRAVEDMLYDELTGVYNRSSGENIMKKSLKEHDGCLMFFDLDSFRKVNIRTGFVRGDLFLKETVECIRQMRDDVVIYRFGGDEFVALFEDTKSEEDAIRLAEKFLRAVRQRAGKNSELRDLSVSVGIVMGEKGKESFPTLLQKADRALYYAKEQGGETYYVHHEGSAERDLCHSGVDLERLLRRIRGNEDESEKHYNYPEMEHTCRVVRRMAKEHDGCVCLVMFTLHEKEGKDVSVEERDHVMDFLEQAVAYSVRKIDSVTKFSSTQRVLSLADMDETAGRSVIDHIMTVFFRMYDKKDIVVHYDLADLSQTDRGSAAR